MSPTPSSMSESITPERDSRVHLLLISESGSGEQRIRTQWSPITGLEKDDLFQSGNANYPGDRNLFPESESVIQVHKLKIGKAVKDSPSHHLYFLAVRIGKDWQSARRGGT